MNINNLNINLITRHVFNHSPESIVLESYMDTVQILFTYLPYLLDNSYAFSLNIYSLVYIKLN